MVSGHGDPRRQLLSQLYLDIDIDLRRFLGSKLRSRQDVDDIAQESYLRALQSDRLPCLENPRAFLFRIASNLVIDRARKSIRQARYRRQFGVEIPVTDMNEIPGPEMSPEQAVAAKQELAMVVEAIESLPPKCKAAFTMQRFEGLSHAEIAAKLGVSKSMVEKYMAKALGQLHRALP